MRNPEIQRIIDAAKQKKFQSEASKGAQEVIRTEAKGLMQTIQDEQTNALRPVFEALGKELVREVGAAVKDAIKNLKVDVPKIDAPTITLPDIRLPPFNIPTPKVTVNVPKSDTPVVNVAPTPVSFPSEMMLKPNSRPFPVIMMDQAGKPVVFTQQTGGATGGRGDFFTIQGFATSIGATLIDSSGVAYSGGNPIPTTFSGALGQGDSVTALRIVQAGDSISSTNVLQIGGNAISTNDGEASPGTLRIIHAADIGTSVNIVGNIATLDVQLVSGSVASTNVLQFNGNAVSTNDGEAGVGTLRIIHAADIGTSVNIIGNTAALDIKQVSGSIDSINVLQIGGTAVDTGAGASSAGTLRTMLASDANLSTVTATDGAASIDLPAFVTRLQAFNGATFDRLSNTGGAGNALRVQQATDAIASTQTNNIAMTTLPTAAADAGVIFQKSDKLGRTLNRPVNVRELIATAYASITTGTEVTLLTAAAGQYLDLIYAMATNNSDAAVTVDLRSVSAGNIETSIRVPANSTAGVSLPVPIPQSATGNAWTADLPDITGTTVTLSALFSKET